MLFGGRKATYEEEEDSHSVFSRTAASSAVQKLHEQEGGVGHTPSGIAFRHLPPNSARFSYATELDRVFITLYLRAAVQRRGQRPPKGSGSNMTVEAA